MDSNIRHNVWRDGYDLLGCKVNLFLVNNDVLDVIIALFYMFWIEITPICKPKTLTRLKLSIEPIQSII